ncbi:MULTISPECIES: beta-galactosidase [unclassified Microbulbifer]|uniref:beta-galactosidase n=1 Tax=unclassified Microbulbifer TaxID=2619833 RepID=UPI0027E5AC47|nr:MULTISPECIES: beta-galactosidase [unclassified Microbulbifer]
MKSTAKTTFILTFLLLLSTHSSGQNLPRQDSILYGVAYYDEYAPGDRLEEDVRMMMSAGINVVRIAESTWGTLERKPGVFDFTHVDRVLAAMNKAGIKVIVGTPTYAIPAWLAHAHPDVLVTTPRGRAPFGPRQNMDITHPEFRKAAERVITALVKHVRNNPAVIGYQVDNETKPYDNVGESLQRAFVERLKSRYPDLDTFNKQFGMDYWSNRINDWDEFPDVTGTVNASISAAFAEFQRDTVTEYLAWQATLVREHARPDQFVTHNFDLGWKGHSYGIQPVVNHFDAARALDIAGVDIYHPSQHRLTGVEIAFGGDLTRSLKGGKNYFVIETQAQGFPEWTPLPGQLRLQAYSHLASGANMVAYWHWGTTANSTETYWRGLLSQDFQPNAPYREAKVIGAELARIGPQLVNMRKNNRIAIYVSNRAQTAFNAFKFGAWKNGKSYNEVMRPFYDALYRMNAEADIIDPTTSDLSNYKLIVVPALYAATDAEIQRLNDFAKAGGHLLYTFKSGFSNENVKVRPVIQPGLIAEAAGVQYQQFAIPDQVTLDGDPYNAGEDANEVRWWMELLTPTSAEVIARYRHKGWGDYAAITRNKWGKGEVTYLGFMPTEALIDKIMQDSVTRAGLWGAHQSLKFPTVVRSGELANGHRVHYIFNYSADEARVNYAFGDGSELLSNKAVEKGESLELGPWGVAIVEEHGSVQ